MNTRRETIVATALRELDEEAGCELAPPRRI